MSLTLFQLLSVLTATAATLFVLVEYLILVPIRRNAGAQRLSFLLAALLALLVLTVLRIFFGDYPGRITVLAVFFYLLTFAMVKLGWHIWRDQVEGARKYRNKRQPEKAERTR